MNQSTLFAIVLGSGLAIAATGCGDDDDGGGGGSGNSGTGNSGTGNSGTGGTGNSGTGGSGNSATGGGSNGGSGTGGDANGGNGTGGGGNYDCSANAGDDACTACMKMACCNELEACADDATCSTCLGCISGGETFPNCSTAGDCSVANGPTSNLSNCAVTDCIPDCY